MKTITTVIALIILTCVGCRTARRVEVIRDMRAPRHLNQREEAAIRHELPTQPQTLPQPPITMQANYASICPYCDTVNLSESVLRTGGGLIVSNQPITVVIARGVVTNTVAPFDGQQENWSLAYTCRNCGEVYSDMRDQLTPKTKSIRLPLRTE